jgi:phosphatidate cytidylyltransferase
MKQRAITAVFFAAAMLGGVYGGRHTFFLLFTVVGAGCLWELTGMLFSETEKHRNFRRLVGVTMGLLPFFLYAAAIYTSWYRAILAEAFSFPSPGGLAGIGEAPYWLVVFVIVVIEVLLLFLLLIAELFTASERPFPNIGYYTLGVIYIGAPLVLLTETAFWSGDYGPHRVFGLLWMVWTNDTLAYLVGSKIGRTKLFERISPKKTWEGTLGGALGALLMAWGVSQFIHEYTLAQWLGIAAVAAVFGNLGDLVESMLKRSVGIKDSGNLFPGHGGFLDRFDAFLFSIPFAWAMLMILEALG